MAAISGEPDEPIYETIYDSIDDLIGKSNGKNADEIKVLKSTIEKLRSKHRLEIAAKENEIGAKELQIQAKEIQIKERENQIQAKGIQIKDFELQNKAKDVQILEQENRILELENEIKEKDNQLKSKDIIIQSLELRSQANKDQMKEKVGQIQAKDLQIKDFETQTKDFELQTHVKENQINDYENEIEAKENTILELENENRLSLKKKKNDYQTGPRTRADAMSPKGVNDAYMSVADLLTNGIGKFFFGKDLQNCFYDSYADWFDVMTTRLTKNTPYIFERFVLVKVRCKDPKNAYYFYSFNGNRFYDQQTNLNIFDKGWRHRRSTVSILHPSLVNKSFQMVEGDRNKGYFHRWDVDSIPKEYVIDESGLIIVLCLKFRTQR